MTETPFATLSQFERLFQHLAWADARALESLRSSGSNPGQALRACAHLLAAEHIWLARIEGRPATLPVWPALTLDECETWARQNQHAFARYLATLTPEEAEREVAYRNSAGQTFSTRVDDILLHVALHGAYHRGQIARDVRLAAHEPKATDYVAFIRGVEAPKAG